MGKFNTKQREYIIKEIKESKSESKTELSSGCLLAGLAGITIFGTTIISGIPVNDASLQTIPKIITLIGLYGCDVALLLTSAFAFLKANGLEKHARDLEVSLNLNDLSGNEVKDEGSRIR